MNKLRLAGLIERPINPHFEVLFETGVDEMSWDDLSQSVTQWPAVSEVRTYRARVYDAVTNLIHTHPDLGSGRAAILEDSPLWALAMSFEHERIHLETSSVLMRELPQPLLRRPEGFVPNHPSVPRADTFSPRATIDYPSNPMVSVGAGVVELGKSRDTPSFGWDNEYGTASREVPAFSASQYKVSNGEFLEFVKGGGYRERRYWSADGWGWRTFRNAKWPTFWTSVGPTNLHQYRLRTVHDIVPMPWAWPAEVNAHEAAAYCNWRAERDGAANQDSHAPAPRYRLVSEAEHMRIRQQCATATGNHDRAENRVATASGADFASDGVNLNFAYGSPSPVDAECRAAQAAGRTPPPFGDAMGNVWEWCADDFHPLDGFKVHPLYDDFSTPCFDGAHNMIMGGSWAATGDEASAFARFHFRPHFFQHAGVRVVCAEDNGAASSVVYLKDGKEEETARATSTAAEAQSAAGKADGQSYESEKLLGEYMMLHYGAADDVAPFEALPREWLAFPQRCAQLVDKWASQLDVPKERALDIGCAVGGSSFELGKTFDQVVGVDLSDSFISAAQRIQHHGSVSYFRRDQGELGETCVADLAGAVAAAKGEVVFERADACALPRELGGFDACLLANLLCRLPRPKECLARLGGPGGLVKPGGLAVIVSPYTWMEEHTPKSTWLGGYTEPNGRRVLSDDSIRGILTGNGFELLDQEDMPLLIREHQRKYQLIVSHAMIFRRRE